MSTTNPGVGLDVTLLKESEPISLTYMPGNSVIHCSRPSSAFHENDSIQLLNT